MKPYARFHKFHNKSKSWTVICRFLFISGISIWLGSLIFFAYGVAPVNFSIARTWNLDGVNPQHIEQTVTYKTIGGALTQQSLKRLNILEFCAILLCSAGLILAWMPKHNRNLYLLSQTVIMSIITLLFIINFEAIFHTMLDLQTNYILDFTITDPTLQSAPQIEFNRLHKLYSTIESTIAVLLITQLILFSVNPIAGFIKDEND